MGTIGSSALGWSDGTLGRVSEGLRVRLHSRNGADIGILHAPGAVAAGDTLALVDGSRWRVVSLVDLSDPHGPVSYLQKSIDHVVDVLCLVEPIEL